jgi:hypothetical protein
MYLVCYPGVHYSVPGIPIQTLEGPFLATSAPYSHHKELKNLFIIYFTLVTDVIYRNKTYNIQRMQKMRNTEKW